MTASGPSTGTSVVSGAGLSHGGHPAAPVASALQSRIGHLPQMTFRQAGIRNPSLPTLLSLFFLLLAFFIVLNSLSQHDARRQSSVASSIDQTFGSGVADPMSAAENVRDTTTGILRGLASYFGALLPADRQKLLITANQLTMHLPVDLFFTTVDGAVSSKETDQAPAILRQIGEALDKRPSGWGCELSIELASKSPGQVDVERAGQLAVILSSTASQRHNDLSVGLASGDPQWLTIVVRLRPPEMPNLPGQASSGGEGKTQGGSGTNQRATP
jgi:hypothetical protein